MKLSKCFTCNIKFLRIVHRYIIWINRTNYYSPIYTRNTIYENTIEWHYIWILSIFNPIAYCPIVPFISSYTSGVILDYHSHWIWKSHLALYMHTLKWARTIRNRNDRILVYDFISNRNWCNWFWINMEYLPFNYFKIEYSFLKSFKLFKYLIL